LGAIQRLRTTISRFSRICSIPIRKRKSLSFKLLNLLLSIGGYVDSAFKEMARYPFFSDNNYCKKILEKLGKSARKVEKGERPITVPIWLCLKAFEKPYKLSQKKVLWCRGPDLNWRQPGLQLHPQQHLLLSRVLSQSELPRRHST
jgi:hypothetical protein